MTPRRVSMSLASVLSLALLLVPVRTACAQAVAQAGDEVIRVDLSSGRSYPIAAPAAITRVSVADTSVMDVMVVSDHELVINGRRSGEADVIVWLANGTRRHYRVLVRSPSDRMQIVLYVKFVEVSRTALREFGASAVFRDQHARIGTGQLRDDTPFQRDQTTGQDVIRFDQPQYVTVLTDFGTKRLLAFLEAEEQNGEARLLAEPNLMAGNRDTATFLAGGEIPIPVASSAPTNGFQAVTIDYREFGVKLRFVGEIISDNLLRLTVLPEVSSLDYTNAITLSGFRIPALRTRRLSSTLDVRRDQSLVLSGMFDNEGNRVRTGVPLLKDIPILGALFSSSSFQRNETELLVVVRPVIVDPNHPRAQDVVPTPPDTALPARKGLQRPKPLPDVKPVLPLPNPPL